VQCPGRRAGEAGSSVLPGVERARQRDRNPRKRVNPVDEAGGSRRQLPPAPPAPSVGPAYSWGFVLAYARTPPQATRCCRLRRLSGSASQRNIQTHTRRRENLLKEAKRRLILGRPEPFQAGLPREGPDILALAHHTGTVTAVVLVLVSYRPIPGMPVSCRRDFDAIFDSEHLEAAPSSPTASGV
jgi:hypothetical protein